MRSYLFTFLFALSLISCSSTDEEIDCSAQLFPVNLFYLEIIDSDGNNLLSNQTYDPEQIEVTFNNVVVSTVQQVDDDTFIIVFFNGIQSASPVNLRVTLGEDEIDEMQLAFTVEELPCRKIYTVQNVIYNDEELEVQTEGDDQKVTIVK
ncbi:hypothetical protein FHG64_03530 [Antarcticibacterium flavum]|uniref:Uncharacterized protein n=1 Tax=Antarcticibacterium flavum TaxID=2058175 RepID=A0A5B7WZX8_9FLAO|nr:MULTISPECIES: hypothetical protein [Antarcticibacterium]MCM4158682.1 hypothetical protein [Antarcticibacterium sp. W02-3]QCY68535.1 hypothetical protein FHG64_03530 [Antarcticibacterium flavum]